MSRDSLVIDFAKAQFGLVSRQQALRAGLSLDSIDSRVRYGQWERVEAGVYRLPGATRDWFQRAMALCLAAEPWAVISHQSAAWLWKLDGVSQQPPEPIDVLVQRGKGLAAPHAHVRFTRHFEGTLDLRQRVPVTTLSRTIIDLAGTMSKERLEYALDSAWRLGPRFQHALARRLSKLSPRTAPGLAQLRALITERDGSLDSELEVRVKQLIWASGLPRPQHNHHVHLGGKWVGKFDFVWPKLELVVQCHGLKTHLVPWRFRRDQVQQSELQSYGWQHLTVTWDQVTREPKELLDRLTRTLAMSRARLDLEHVDLRRETVS